MAEFTKVREFLEQNGERLAQIAGGEYEFELHNLHKGLWQSETDEEVLLGETLRVMQKYPAVWSELEKAGLVSTPAPVIPTASQATQTVRIADPDATTSTTFSGRAMNPQQNQGQQLSQTTLDRLATWDKAMVIFKEGVAGCMGLLLISATLFIAFNAFVAAFFDNAAVSATAKEILLILVGLVGVVLGYYFGRVPTEARADKAQSEANTARSELVTSQAQTNMVRNELDQTKVTVQGVIDSAIAATARDRSGTGEISLSSDQLAQLRTIVQRPTP